MAIMDKLSDLVGGNLADGVAKIISLFKVDPNVALEKSSEIEKIKLEMAGKLQDALTQEIQTASNNIRAEENSGDKYTARARPSFMYMIEVVIFFNFVVLGFLKRYGWTPIDLPQPLYWLFGSVVLGYTGARTWEKFMGMPGASNIELPFGIKAGNDGTK